MTNPLEDFLAMKKEATPPAPGMGPLLKNTIMAAGATAGVSAGVSGMGVAASKIYDALTKKRDFNQMLELNPDLQEHHTADPKKFNQMFTTLRSMNSSFSKDPLVAGTYMRRMVESPLSAGGIAVETIGHQRFAPAPMSEAFHRGAGAGAEKAVAELFKSHPPRADFKEQRGIERMKHDVKAEKMREYPEELGRPPMDRSDRGNQRDIRRF